MPMLVGCERLHKAVADCASGAIRQNPKSVCSIGSIIEVTSGLLFEESPTLLFALSDSLSEFLRKIFEITGGVWIV